MSDVTVGVVVDTGVPANFDDDAPIKQWPIAISASDDGRGYALGFNSGKVIDYHLVHDLGGGSQGGVKLIADASSGQAFALKLFRSPKDAQKELRWVGNPEVELSMVPAVALMMESTKEHVVLMRIGTPLNDAYSDIPKDSSDRLQVAETIASAVADLERMLIDMGVVYTDVKPDNILAIPVEGRSTAVRLVFMDYGGLCSASGKEECLFTIGYVPPEMWKRAAHGYTFDNDQAMYASRFWGGKIGDYLLGDNDPSDRLKRFVASDPETRFAKSPHKRTRYA
jgi:serine/threonine protein kinase